MPNQDKLTRTYATPKTAETQGGPGSAGQSGDTQGLPAIADAGDQSVKELVEEGQTYEAEVLLGVEDAPDADVSEVHTHEVPQDDVPPEYVDTDEPPRANSKI